MKKNSKSESNKSIIILVGPGFGHYHPIASLAIDLLNNDIDVIMVGDVSNNSALAERIREDGFDFYSLSMQTKQGLLIRAFNRVWIRFLDLLYQEAAKLPTQDELPHLLARFIFGVRSYTKPLPGLSYERIKKISQITKEHSPMLIMTDAVSADGINFLSAMHNIPWFEYTTSPANIIEKDRPIYPVGLSPNFNSSEKLVNNLMLWMYTLRQVIHRKKLLNYFPASLKKKPFFEPKNRVCFSTQEVDDYSNNQQDLYQYVGISPYRFDASGAGVDIPKDGIYVSFGSTGTKKDREILKWIAHELSKYDLPVYLQILNPDILAEVKQAISIEHREKFNFIGRLPGPAYDVYQNSRLVISHGGYNTVLESLYFGCPILLIPNIAADRMEVARRAIENGYGHCINYYRLDSKDFHIKLADLLGNPEIQKTIRNLQGNLRDSTNYQKFQNQIYTQIDKY